MSDDQPVRKKCRKRGGWYVVIIGLVVLVGGLGLFRWRQKSKLEVRIAAIRAAGYPVSCAELDDWYTIPSGAANAAGLILDAVSLYREPNEPDLVPIAGEAELPGRTAGLSEEMKRAIDRYLASNKKALELLHEAGGIEHSRYPIDLSPGITALLPHLREVRDMARLLKIEAAIRVEDDQADQAVASISALLGLGRSLRNEPVLISQLVRVACESLGVSAIERVVNRSRPDEEQLIELEGLISQAGSGLNFPRSMQGERCFVLDILRDPAGVDPLASGNPRLTGVLFTVLKGTGLTYKGAMLYLDFVDEFMHATGLPENERIAAARAIEKRLEEGRGLQIRLLQMYAPAYARLFELDLRNIAIFRAARAALAIERYRLAQGKLPGALDELVGEYLNAVPKDPFDGAELRYIRLEKGYVVYSIGEDGSDDEGQEKKASGKDNWDITFTVER